jgi:hypothetical protein
LTAVVSLLVCVVVTDAFGEESELGESLAAGFGLWRTEVWGSPQVSALGAEFFPRLASGTFNNGVSRSEYDLTSATFFG